MVLAFGLHGLWEVMQLPLYTLWSEPNRWLIVAYLLHCLVGDVLIATALFLLVAALLRDSTWPAHKPWFGGTATIVAGVVYTGFSEWYNVYQTHAWRYTEAMPLLFGIGVSPLLQWIVVSAVMVVLLANRNRSV